MSNRRIRQKQLKTTKTIEDYERYLLVLIEEQKKLLQNSSPADKRKWDGIRGQISALSFQHQHLRNFQLK